jgi:hypothetical protein
LCSNVYRKICKLRRQHEKWKLKRFISTCRTAFPSKDTGWEITIICFFRTKCSLPLSKVSVLLAEIRLTKPHFDTSSLNIKEIPFAFSLPSLSCWYS